MTEMEVLTPQSPRWDQFTDWLDAALEREGCDGDTHRHAKAIMCKMGGIDIAGSLAFFEDHGGYCDCEILLNVDQAWRWADRKFGELSDTDTKH